METGCLQSVISYCRSGNVIKRDQLWNKMANPQWEQVLCGHNEQESQSKQSRLVTVHHPHKEYLLLLRVLPFSSEAYSS